MAPARSLWGRVGVVVLGGPSETAAGDAVGPAGSVCSASTVAYPSPQSVRPAESATGPFRTSGAEANPWTHLRAAEATIKGIREMEMVRTKSLEEIKTWRDKMMVDILKVMRE